MDKLIEALNLLGASRPIQALIVALLSVVLAKIAKWVLARAFTRLTRRTKTDIDNQILEMLHGPVFNSTLLAGFAAALALLELQDPFGRWGLALIKTLAVLIWLVFAIRLSSLVLSSMASVRTRFEIVQPATLPLFDNAAKILLLGGASYFVLISWDVNVTGWLASAGIIGLALGFAARDTLANLFAGVSIIADAPYKVGDFIVLPTGERGQVIRIGIRSTRILTRDDIEITIPNSIIAGSMIVNESGGPWVKHRIRIRTSAAYGSDVDRVRQILLDAASETDQVCHDPEPRVRFREFGDSGLIFELLCWIEEPAFRGQVQDALNTAVYKAFAREGVEIPYPKRDVYIKGMPASQMEQDPKLRN